MSSQWKWGICKKFGCHKCHEVIGMKKDDPHECDEDTVKTVAAIKTDTRPCPKCHCPIYKISGCDQMWCTQCQTPFSWRTGRIVNGTIHNPHYHHWMRQNGGGIQQPGARLCGGLPSLQQIRTALVNLKGNKIVRSLGADFINHQSWILSLIRLNEGWSFDSYRYIDKTLVMNDGNLCMKKDSSPGGIMELDKEWWTRKLIDQQEKIVLIPPKSIIAILKMLQSAQRHLRGIQHFNLVELDDLRRNCQRQRDNKIYRT